MSAEHGLILIGVGGGGCQLAAAARLAFDDRLQAIGVDTDKQAIGGIQGLQNIVLGEPRLGGMGTGGDSVKGRLAMQDSAESVKSLLTGVHTAVVVVTLGGGTGGGTTPELLRTLRQMEITTLCFALMPFTFEDAARHQAAERALPQLDENADTVVVVPQDDLWQRVGAAEMSLTHAGREASRTFGHGLTLLWRLLLAPGFIRFDPARLRAVIVSRGRARFYVSEATGAARATDAADDLIDQLSKSDSTAPSRAAVLGILAGEDLRLAELGSVMQAVKERLPQDCRLDMGTIVDARCKESLCLVALVFETWSAALAGAGVPAAPPPVAAWPSYAKGGRRGGRGSTTSKKSKLGYNTGRGRFRDIEATIFNGEDMDIPTFVRKHITL